MCCFDSIIYIRGLYHFGGGILYHIDDPPGYQSDFFRYFYVNFLPEKIEVNLKIRKSSTFLNFVFVIQLYIARGGSGSEEKFPDPTKKVLRNLGKNI